MSRSGVSRRVLVGLVGALLCALMLAPSSASAARPFTRGFADDVWFTTTNPQYWVQKTVATGAKRVQLEVDWISIEPNAPSGAVDPTSPSDPEYNFSGMDARVREFAGTGMQVTFVVTEAPPWAEAPGGPAALEASGAWEPNATAFGQFAQALAARYSGSFPDPLNPGQTLPRVRYFEVWGEPNLTLHIAPQWTTVGGHLVNTGADIYRSLLNAFYAGVKKVHSDDLVSVGGLAPYGDRPGGQRTAPVTFFRSLLCLSGTALKPLSCPNPAHYDVLAADPYEVGGPTTKAISPNDVSAPDLHRLTKVANKAERTGRLLPRGHKQLWVTEFSYDSNPPNPSGLPAALQARFMEEAFYVFWRQGVNTAFWYLVRDSPGRNFNADYYSGVYFYNGNPKPSLVAYQFPFVVMPAGKTARAWGIAPRGGKVSVQRQQGRKWRTLFRIHASAGGVFVRNVSLTMKGNFRAVVGAETSLTWHRS